MSVTLRLTLLQYPWVWGTRVPLNPHAMVFKIATGALQWPLRDAKLRICTESGWRLLENGEEARPRLLPLESLIWTWLAALRVQDAQGRKFWLLSLRNGRSDTLFRRWTSTLTQVSADGSAGTTTLTLEAGTRP